MNTSSSADISAAQAFAREANRLRESGALEEPLKLNLFHHLPLIFTEHPTWLLHHVSGAESFLQIATQTGMVGRFADSLVGLTSIEYEPDLRRDARLQNGLKQVREHCAGLLNRGAAIEKIVGVLSDTVLWLAYSIQLIEGAEIGRLGADDLVLVLLAKMEVRNDTAGVAKDFVEFLERYLGRRGSLPLNAGTVNFDLGFDGLVGRLHAVAVAEAVEAAFTSCPGYADLIEELWVQFVAVAGSGSSHASFVRQDYANELYLVTLAKLICANVLEGRAIRSGEDEIGAILSGSYFLARGLDNVVEYDYFGWLCERPHAELLLRIATEMQDDLQAYDFSMIPAEDVFGQLMAALGERSHRLLLGQEFTPAWLCSLMADELLCRAAAGVPLRAVDMCCGSGALLVAVSNRYRERLLAEGHQAGEAPALRLLIDAATGFDVDPLAVMLAKVNWVIANREWLVPGVRVTIPVYHADSLFLGVPFAADDPENDTYRLTLYGDVGLDLPIFVIEPRCRQLFDDLLHRAYDLTRAVGGDVVEMEAIGVAVEGALDGYPGLADAQVAQLVEFFGQLVAALLELQKAGLNGVWAFILRNCYRPSLVAGQFNALISNPPWMALSKITANPYGASLRAIARELSLSPPGAAHLHTELATTFLYTSVDRFLDHDGVVACILPESILNGFQHTPFRKGAPIESARRVPLAVESLWRVERGTFKNEAVVLVGSKRQAALADAIDGKRVSRDCLDDNPFHVVNRGNRTVWSDLPAGLHPTGFFDAGNFRQGADLMPRTVVFHEFLSTKSGRWQVGAIDRQLSPLRYLVKGAKRLKGFSIASGTVAERFVFRAAISSHLTPFMLADAAVMMLPAVRNEAGWVAITPQVLAADRSSAQVFGSVLDALVCGSPAEYLATVETERRKLSVQHFAAGQYLVVFGAGGGVVCSAFRVLTEDDAAKLAIDQTLYWHVVATEDEALYLVGMFNAPAMAPVIAAFQPQGQQGERHIHKLPALVTPRFDPGDPAHQAVVVAVRLLIEEWRAEVECSEALRLQFDPCKDLARRRSVLRRAILALPGSEAWIRATAEVFAVSTEQT